MHATISLTQKETGVKTTIDKSLAGTHRWVKKTGALKDVTVIQIKILVSLYNLRYVNMFSNEVISEFPHLHAEQLSAYF